MGAAMHFGYSPLPIVSPRHWKMCGIPYKTIPSCNGVATPLTRQASAPKIRARRPRFRRHPRPRPHPRFQRHPQPHPRPHLRLRSAAAGDTIALGAKWATRWRRPDARHQKASSGSPGHAAQPCPLGCAREVRQPRPQQVHPVRHQVRPVHQDRHLVHHRVRHQVRPVHLVRHLVHHQVRPVHLVRHQVHHLARLARTCPHLSQARP